MISYTTPTFIFTIPASAHVEQALDVYFSIEQNDVKLTKHNLDVVENVVSVYLRHEESGKFQKGKAKIQLNWVYVNGRRAAMKPKQIDVEDNLLREVI